MMRKIKKSQIDTNTESRKVQADKTSSKLYCFAVILANLADTFYTNKKEIRISRGSHWKSFEEQKIDTPFEIKAKEILENLKYIRGV